MKTETELCKEIIKWLMENGRADYCSLCENYDCEGESDYDTCLEEIIKQKKKEEESLSYTLPLLQVGDIVKCLNCGGIIRLDEETVGFNGEIGYIVCPNCKTIGDIKFYSLVGEKVEEIGE